MKPFLVCGGAAAFLAAALGLAAVPAPAGPPVAGGLAPIDVAGLKKQIAARKGKVVVVNFWATWCGPCKEEFPDLVKLQNANKAKGLELVTVAFDDAKSTPAIKAFLSKNKLASGTFVNKTGANLDDAYITYLEPKLPSDAAVAIPRTYVFDKTGKLRKVLLGGQSYAAFQSAVAPLLAAK